MIAIATIYSLCSLCGPHEKRCARFNAYCNVPKVITTSEKEHARSVRKWTNEIVKKRTISADKDANVHRVKLTESQMMTYFDDDWLD
jgi:hypothetical protein